MKVYITFEKDGYNGEQVEKVFLREEAAQDHIIKDLKRRSVYADKEIHELQEMALEYIEEHTVVE